MKVLTTIGRSPNFLRDILAEARSDYLQAQSRKTMVYTLSPTPFAQKTWDQGRHRPSRDISTVIMPPNEKQHLLQDVREYLNPVTMRWYAQRGLPYRRGYLFYGPPGTGKTSLSLALAGELKLPLYILSLSTGSLTDETLTMLFVGLPRKCIVLLEDIDCAGVHRNGGITDDSSDEESDTSEDDDAGSGDDSSAAGSKKAPSTKSASSSSSSKPKTGAAAGGKTASGGKSGSAGKPGSASASSQAARHPRISVSFSGLLNAIDGVASHEGRILIMTTNHRERLDSALIRPGRVDVQIEFGYAGKGTLSEIFRELYKEIGERGSAEKRLSEREMVNRLAEEFAQKIPEDRFTPAEVQGFLISYKGQPMRALENVEEWVLGKTRTDRDKKSRSDRKKRAKKNAYANSRIEKASTPNERPATPPAASSPATDLIRAFDNSSHVNSASAISSEELMRAFMKSIIATNIDSRRCNCNHGCVTSKPTPEPESTENSLVARTPRPGESPWETKVSKSQVKKGAKRPQQSRSVSMEECNGNSERGAVNQRQ